MPQYNKWSVKEEDLIGLTPEKARDLIVKCLFEAQKETIRHAKEKLGREIDDEQIYQSVISIVKFAFTDTKSSFKNPTKATLIRVIQRLAEISKSWGTPEELIQHHKSQIQKVISNLK